MQLKVPEQSVKIENIGRENFKNYSRYILDTLIPNIWDYSPNDIDETKDTVLEYYTEWWTGTYFFIKLNWKRIWITWFYEIDPENGLFGLRHHGILKEFRKKWIGSYVLRLLLKEIQKKYKDVKWIVELVPKGNSFIYNAFIKMWFIEADNNIIQHKKIKDQLDEWYYDKVLILKT